MTQYASVTTIEFPYVFQTFLSAIDMINLDLGWFLGAVCVFNVRRKSEGRPSRSAYRFSTPCKHRERLANMFTSGCKCSPLQYLIPGVMGSLPVQFLRL